MISIKSRYPFTYLALWVFKYGSKPPISESSGLLIKNGNSHTPLKDTELDLQGDGVLEICISNKTSRKFLCLLANDCSRSYLIFVYLIQLISVNLLIFPYISVFALDTSNLCHCVHIESRCFLTDSTFYPYEYISVIIFVPFKAGGLFSLKACVFL